MTPTIAAAWIGKATVCAATGQVFGVADSRLVIVHRHRCGAWPVAGVNFCGGCGAKLGRDDGRKP